MAVSITAAILDPYSHVGTWLPLADSLLFPALPHLTEDCTVQ